MNGRLLILIAAAGVVGTIGVLIKYFGRVELIAGYDPDRVTDEDGLANFVGTNLLYVSGLVFVVAIGDATGLFGNRATDAVWLAATVAYLSLLVRMVYGTRRYEADE
ncbi:DUF3784 domain-containing protein [Halopiger djelfimassiliensis]|uniref:DUF3784 domain-containing protein n=1 Tax=Halopiger djelfimassiliensis TaxID=1293047 RepID=UPI000677C892|nr:DUF3784 domain-containing protein [Halopiger djelfimassiliensis]